MLPDYYDLNHKGVINNVTLMVELTSAVLSVPFTIIVILGGGPSLPSPFSTGTSVFGSLWALT